MLFKIAFWFVKSQFAGEDNEIFVTFSFIILH